MNPNRKLYPLTVKELQTLCEEQIKKGNGEKYIAISQDDECNGFHDLFEGFSSTSLWCKGEYMPWMPEDKETMLKEYILLM